MCCYPPLSLPTERNINPDPNPHRALDVPQDRSLDDIRHVLNPTFTPQVRHRADCDHKLCCAVCRWVPTVNLQLAAPAACRLRSSSKPSAWRVQSDLPQSNLRRLLQEVAALSGEARSFARALDGSEYLPGLVGMNNMKANDYANVVVQASRNKLRWQGVCTCMTAMILANDYANVVVQASRAVRLQQLWPLFGTCVAAQ